MGNLNLTAKEINKNVSNKLKLRNVKSNRERYGDFYLDDKYQFRVVMPNIHGGSGSVSPLMLKACRLSVRLSTNEFYRLVKCPMEREEYISIIKKKIK